MGRFDKIKKNIVKKKRRIHYLYIFFVIILLIIASFIGSEYQKSKRTELQKLGLIYNKDVSNLIKIIKHKNIEINNLYSVLNSIPLGPPVDSVTIASRYGYRKDPFNDSITFHTGTDINAEYQQKIFATGNGLVLKAKYINGYGNCIIIKHAYNFLSLYAHLTNIFVNEGDSVFKNQIIGSAGSTGKSTNVHLHYEIHNQFKPLNPEDFIYISY